MRITRFAFLAGLCLFNGCAWITEPIRMNRAMKEALPAGIVIQAQGVSITAPEDGVLLRTNKPRKGFVSFYDGYPFDPGSYNVFPFRVDEGTGDPKAAWHRHMRETGRPKFVRKMRIEAENYTEWNGVQAWYVEAYFPPTVKRPWLLSAEISEGDGFVLAGLSTARAGEWHYFINRCKSIGFPEDAPDKMKEARREFTNFLSGVALR